MDDPSITPAQRILLAWTALERALRRALPVCSVAPPNQPGELLAALRINHRLGPEEELEITALRELRTRVAHAAEEPSLAEVTAYEARVAKMMRWVADASPGSSGYPTGTS